MISAKVVKILTCPESDGRRIYTDNVRAYNPIKNSRVTNTPSVRDRRRGGQRNYVQGPLEVNTKIESRRQKLDR